MSRIDYVALAAELTAGHPVTGAYNVDDGLAAGELNALNRDAPASAETIRNYCLLESKNGESLLGRIEMVAESTVGADPLAEATPLTLKHIANAKAFLHAISGQSTFSLDLTDLRFDGMISSLAAGAGCAAIQPADKTAILGMSENKSSRAAELGFGRVTTSHVIHARAL